MQDGSSLKILGLVVVTIGMLSLGCKQVVTVYWSKPGAGNAKLQSWLEESPLSSLEDPNPEGWRQLSYSADLTLRAATSRAYMPQPERFLPWLITPL